MDGWYYRLFEAEFGPLSFDELVALVRNKTLSREDQVRYGNAGVWRQAGSIGPLMAHFPFQAAKHVVSRDSQREFEARKRTRESTVAKPLPSTSARVPELPQRAASPSLPASVESETNSGLPWWCVIQDKEYGPVAYAKVLEWVQEGRLHPADHLRCGRETYRLARTVPGLFPERPKSVATNGDISAVSETQAMLVTRSKSKESHRKKSSDAAIEAWLLKEMPEPAKVTSSRDRVRQTAATSLSSASVNSLEDGNHTAFAGNAGLNRGPNSEFAHGRFGKSTVSASRSVTAIRRPVASGKGSGNIVEILTSSSGLRIGGAILAVVLLFFALPYLPLGDSANAKHYKKLRDAVNQVSFLRNDDNVRPEQFKPLQSNLEQVANAVLDEVKDGNAAGQRRLKNLAQKVQEMAKVDLTKPSDVEKAVNTQLLAAAKELRIN